MSLLRRDIGYLKHGLAIDTIALEPTGIVRVAGWAPDDSVVDELGVAFDGVPIPLAERHREWRPDVQRAGGAPHAFAGFVAEFRAPRWHACHGVAVTRGGRAIAQLKGPFTFVEPHYGVLLDTSTVYGRAEIYTSGPAPAAFNEPALDLALSAPGTILDFGCGSGVYLRELRARGRNAEGLEVDSDAVRAVLATDVRPHVRLYPGGFPIALPDGSYDTCLAFEVLEHIPEFRAAIAELARIAREAVVVTVPDAGAIPRLFPHYAVPWHLLEGGHVNFFTQRSLHACLAPHFARIDLMRICPHQVNGTVIYTSVAAICWKR